MAIGAHPSLPDLQGFGRRVMKISPQDMYDLVVYQAGAVEAFARAAGAKLHHIKCHGALYNMAANDEGLSDAMVRAAKDLGGVMLYVLSNSKNYDIAKRPACRVCGEVFADRGYTDDGTLAPRDKPGGMIEDAEKAVKQALAMVEERSSPASPASACRWRPTRSASTATSRARWRSPRRSARCSRSAASRSRRRSATLT